MYVEDLTLGRDVHWSRWPKSYRPGFGTHDAASRNRFVPSDVLPLVAWHACPSRMSVASSRIGPRAVDDTLRATRQEESRPAKPTLLCVLVNAPTWRGETWLADLHDICIVGLDEEHTTRADLTKPLYDVHFTPVRAAAGGLGEVRPFEHRTTRIAGRQAGL